MLIRLKLYPFLIFLSLSSVEQSTIKTFKIKKAVEDTINYAFILHNNGYQLFKVTENSRPVTQLCRKKTWIYKADSLRSKHYRFPKIKAGDTLIYMDWFAVKNKACIEHPICEKNTIGKVRLNKKSNMMLIDKIFCDRHHDTLQLFLKVIKFSKSEIILEDLKNKPWPRFYYFRENNR